MWPTEISAHAPQISPKCKMKIVLKVDLQKESLKTSLGKYADSYFRELISNDNKTKDDSGYTFAVYVTKIDYC